MEFVRKALTVITLINYFIRKICTTKLINILIFVYDKALVGDTLLIDLVFS